MLPVLSMIGNGKLGMPVAVALASKFKVVCYDVNPDLRKHRQYPYKECGYTLETTFQEEFDKVYSDGKGNLSFASSLEELTSKAHIIFVAVQTPHKPEFDGSALLSSNEREDFDYTYLKEACSSLAPLAHPLQTVVVISTVLPGTMRREILPILQGKCGICYNPAFPGMGTVMYDFLNPEFVLLGGEDETAIERVSELYETIHGNRLFPPILTMSLESAELTKVSYNLQISAKIANANALGELAHKTTHCNIDDITNALTRANKRIVSSAYMKAGTVDAGACHPRDAIAMSWLADKLNLTYNPFEQIVQSREKQSEWLVDLFIKEAGCLPKILLGKAFKPESNITAGSAALLCADILRKKSVEFTQWDPFVLGPPLTGNGPAAYLIVTKHKQFSDYPFLSGSVVVDPFRYVLPCEGVRIIPIGIG